MAITKEVRMAVLSRASERCEYCQISLSYSADPVVVDHVVPLTRGGTDLLGNLAASCWGCNAHKAAGTRAFDPQEAQLVPLFNPRDHKWLEHFQWNDDQITVVGITAIGRAAVLKLNLNRQGLLNLRAVLRLVGMQPPR